MKSKLLFLLSFVLLTATAVFAQNTDKDFILVESDSKIEIPAQEITFSIELEMTDTVAQSAYNGMKELEKNFMPLLKKFEIPDSNISYSLTSLSKGGGYNNRRVNYIAKESVVIRLNDFKQYEPFQLALLSIGINQFHGQFSAIQIGKEREIGFKEALEKAKKEAELICKNIDRKLGKVLEVESRNRDYVVTSGLTATGIVVQGGKLIDLPQHVNLYTKVKVKYELK